MKTSMIRDLNTMVGNIKVTPETRKALGLMGIGGFVIGFLFFGLPWLVENAWNSFFSAVFHLSRLSYVGSLSLIFWIAVAVVLIVLVKD